MIESFIRMLFTKSPGRDINPGIEGQVMPSETSTPPSADEARTGEFICFQD
jgi:hypothetical protein